MSEQHNKLKVPDFKTRASWIAYGHTVKDSEDTQWRLGDWWNARNVVWGDSEELAAEVGIGYGVARNRGSVADAFPLSLRNDKLTWEHHRVAMAAPVKMRQIWLHRAAAGDGDGKRWSTSRLRSEIKQAKAKATTKVAGASTMPEVEAVPIAPVNEVTEPLDSAAVAAALNTWSLAHLAQLLRDLDPKRRAFMQNFGKPSFARRNAEMSELLRQMIALVAPEKRITPAICDDLRAKLNRLGGLMRQGGDKAPDLTNKTDALRYSLSAPKASGANGTQPDDDATNTGGGQSPTLH